MLRETKKGNMEELVHALIALRGEFRRPEKPVAEPEFKPFDLSALTRPYGVEDAGRNRQRPVVAAGSVRHGNQVVASDREPGAVTEALGTYL